LLSSLPAKAAEAPVGIVMSVSGTPEPQLSPMTELAADAPVRLMPGSEVTFLHYARCKLVTVTGGTLTMNQTAYHSDGRVTAESDAPCPVVAEVADAERGGTAGGLIVRGIQAAPRWPTRLDIALTGPRAGKVRGAAVYDDARPPARMLRLDFAGRRLTPPADSAPLPPNHRYTLRLDLADRPEPLEFPFFAREVTGAASLLVLRIE
jgi:hypothetical protein